jgi:expansin (peptidoglycan-binding protein)
MIFRRVTLRAALVVAALCTYDGCADADSAGGDGGATAGEPDATLADDGARPTLADAAAAAQQDGGRNEGGGHESQPDAAHVASEALVYGQTYSGGEFHLGPVDWAERAFHNACAAGSKYPTRVQQAGGALLAGIAGSIARPESYCDACIYVRTARGKSALLRVVTYGATSANSIDVSREAFALLDSGEYPRSMSFHFSKCADSGKLMYEFKSGAHQDWTAFWVRNARVPIRSVEVMGAKHAYSSCRREADGSLVDDAGFGKGTFSIRVTAVDGQIAVDTFSWPAAGIASQLLEGAGNFK